MPDLLLAVVGVLAGSVAAVSGFGVGSLLTPVLALRVGTKLAVGAVAIPHAIGTGQRFWLLSWELGEPGAKEYCQSPALLPPVPGRWC